MSTYPLWDLIAVQTNISGAKMMALLYREKCQEKPPLLGNHAKRGINRESHYSLG